MLKFVFRVFISGVEAFTLEHPDVNLTPNLSCEEGNETVKVWNLNLKLKFKFKPIIASFDIYDETNDSFLLKWPVGDMFYKSLRNVSIELDNPKPPIQFNQDGILKNAELQIMNLRPGATEKQLQWEQVGFIAETISTN